MNTKFALLAKFESPIVPLKDICKDFFGISPKTAETKAAAADLPVPTFKLRESQRSPTLIKVEDLAKYIDSCHLEGTKIWNSVRNHY